MMKRLRLSADGLARMQSELTQMRGALEMHRRQHQNHTFPHHPSISEFSSSMISSTTMKPLPHRYPEMVPQLTPRKTINTDMQNLADIILHQAHRIEKQQRELHCLKLHYERQVSTIKSNAMMLEQQLTKLQSNVNRSKALHMGKHFKEIAGAVDNLQKCGLDLSKPQTISNHLLTKLLTSKTNQEH
ncbi:hypothetical protein KR032_001865 [Drosophila birchii]|nr:hypothetical protein KR032_001865 [Drosophila birchii]